MSLGISTHNYLNTPEIISIVGANRKNLLRYNYCPGVEDTEIFSLTIKNLHNASLPISSLVMGNVKVSDIIISDITLNNIVIASNVTIYSTAATNYAAIFDTFVSTEHIKILPILLDLDSMLEILPDDSLTINFSTPVKLGWLWCGNLHNLSRGLSKPTRSEIKDYSKYTQLENGDNEFERGVLRKHITCGLKSHGDDDRSFVQNNLKKNSLYLISAFKPFSSAICNIYDMPYSAEFDDKVVIWKGFTGLTRLTNDPQFSTDQIGFYSTSLSFSEVI